MKHRRPNPSPPSPDAGGSADLAAGLRASVEEAAPDLATELSALLRRPMEVTFEGASGPRPSGRNLPSLGRPGPVATITIDFHGEVAGRGTLSFDHACLARLAHWLPAGAIGQPVSWDRNETQKEPGFGSASAGREARALEEFSEPLVRGALLEIGSVLLGGVLAAFLQRSATCISLGLPRWSGPTGPPPADVPAGHERLAVSLRLCSSTSTSPSTSAFHAPEAAIVWLQFLRTDQRVWRGVDCSAGRKVMA